MHAASSNDFEGLLLTNFREVQVEEDGSTLNVLLHSVYGLDVTLYAPNWVTLKDAIEAMQSYHISLLSLTEPLCALLISNLHGLGGALDVNALSSRCGPDALVW
ncbi:hypothetical protein EXIGLDRAFT_780737 [Exidia glandulosa HHB12029]|uniref:BTB domain-containing protein n=1 Tax=Exidia glandulosa HHB12029 TaxID=1314781 RepID=A0A165BGU6_EXIGL|nr:hypothetical protein EXIGLDRAFT_780737 [Exidia glandulosa HHB12029]